MEWFKGLSFSLAIVFLALAGLAPHPAAAMTQQEFLTALLDEDNDIPAAIQQALAEGMGVEEIISHALIIDGMNSHQVLLSLCQNGANPRDITQAASENEISPMIIAAAADECWGEESDTQAYSRQARNNARRVIPSVVRQRRERTDLFVSPSTFQ
ncbi:MAG: hypothetical protein ABFR97_05320 [Thermodesulfobacteriota bacterium]